MATGLSDVAAISPEDDTGAGEHAEDDKATGNVFRFHFMFDESAEKLEFEVAWALREDGERVEPCAGPVDLGGHAQRRGILPGDAIVACNDILTEGKVRTDLIPLFKKRPLLLKVDRLIQGTSRVELKMEFGEEVKGLGIKLSESASPPYIAEILRYSAAEANGLMIGDTLVALNGEEPPQNGEELKKRLKTRPLTITVCRFPVSTIGE
jgi:predicted metalloprotease with PDZ domain